jgi:hypothetical protein
MCKERSLERDSYINEGAPTIDQISEKKRNNLLAELYDDAEGDALIKMHDIEELHQLTYIIHRHWKYINNISLGKTEWDHELKLNDRDFINDIMAAWQSSLSHSLKKEANKELEYRHEAKQEKFEE